MRSRSARRLVASATFLIVVFMLTLRTSRLGDAPPVVPAIHGCTSVPQPCAARARADRVVYAQVLETTACPVSGPALDDHAHTVRFRVSRVFKGDVMPGGEWSGEFRETPGAHRFSPPERVLVYAARRGVLWETECSRTRAFSARDTDRLNDEIAQLERCGSRR
jgi:hypothetical protein